MKLIINTLIMLSLVTGFSQNKYYTLKDNTVKKVPVLSDYTLLNIQQINFNASQQNSVLSKGSGVEILAGLITNLPKYVIQIIKGNKKKYMAEYEARNTLTSWGNDIYPKLILSRYINTSNKSDDLSAHIEILPKKTQKDFFAFYVDNASVKYSQAKIKKGYTHLILLIEITAVYGEKDDNGSIVNKKEITSKPIRIPITVGSNQPISSNLKSTLSETFQTANLMEVRVKVTETNPFKIRLDQLQTTLEDNGELLGDIFSKLGELLKK